MEKDTKKKAESLQKMDSDQVNPVEANTMNEAGSLQTMDSIRQYLDESKNQIQELEDQKAELKKLVDKSHREMEELKQREVQQTSEIKRLNTKLADVDNADKHVSSGRYRGPEAKSYDRINNLENINQHLQLDINVAEKTNTKLQERLKSLKLLSYGVGGVLLIIMLVVIGIFYTRLPCRIYVDQIKELTIQIDDIKSENIQLKRSADSTKDKLIEVQEEAKLILKGKASLEIQMEQETKMKYKLERDLKEVKTIIEGKEADFMKRMTDLKNKINVDADKFYVELDNAQTKLSKCLTVNDNSVTSINLSPIKLGQDFRAIYEQHYTMAIDELEGRHGESDVKATVQMFLNILKTAHNLTYVYTEQHIESMEHSTTSVEIEIPEHIVSSEDSTTSIELPEQKSQVSMEKVYVNSTFTKTDWKDFYEIRQKSALRMLDQITKELGEVIAVQFNVDSGSQPKMMNYIKQCVSLCWKTNMHREPVYIDFNEPDSTAEFDYEIFKPFMYQSGNYIDYVVWPPMFEKKGGHLIAKGIAERKD